MKDTKWGSQNSFLIILLTTTLQGVVSAGEPPGPNYECNSATGPEVRGFRLMISVTNTIFQLGQAMDLTISLHNTSTNNAMISISELDYSFEIFGPDGKAIPATELGTNTLLHPMRPSFKGTEISAGHAFVVKLPLNDLFRMTNIGKYTIRVSRNVDREKSVCATSDPLTILITKPSKPQ